MGLADSARSQNSQELAQQTSNMEAGTALGNKRVSAVVFMNPDSTFSYAVKEEEGSSAEHSVRDQLQAQAVRSGRPPSPEVSSAPVDQGALTSRTSPNPDASHSRAIG